MRLSLVTPPADLPVSLADAKAHLRVDSNGEDDAISGYIEAATAQLDGFHGVLGRALLTQTWDATLDSFPGYGGGFLPRAADPRIQLLLPPVQSIVSVKYRDGSGAEQTVGSSTYRLAAGAYQSLVLAAGQSWPADVGFGTVVIRQTCGYGNEASAVPAPIRQAILMLTARLYAARGEAMQANLVADPAIESLIAPYRVWLA